MPIADLIGGRGAVPTVRAFFRALAVFGPEVRIARELCREVPDGLDMTLVIAPFLATPGDKRLEFVLEGCTLPPEVGIAAIVESLTRLDHILGAPGEPDEGPTDDVGPEVSLILACAERAHTDPMSVMDWPIGLFIDSISRSLGGRSAPSGQAAEVFEEIIPGIQAEGVVGGPTPAPDDEPVQ